MSGSLVGRMAQHLPENNRLERIWKLAQIDFMRRYYNDRLGLLWALINPMFQIAVFYIVFTRIFNSREENFILFLFLGILIWGVFSESSRASLAILRAKRYLIENVQVNKFDLFLSHTLSVFMGFAFNLVIYLVVAMFLDASFNANALFIIPVLITLFLICMGTSMLLNTIYIFIDDIRHVWDIVVFLGFWTSGILYSVDKIIEVFPAFVYINPFLGLLKNGRNAFLYGLPPDYFLLVYNFVFAVLLLLISNYIFKRCEHLITEKL
ncbi:MAG: ABC transporter permease [Saprospiraceae bacterium]|nr:ABC transporter permease [Saprospiraceae bacterium]